MYIHVIIDYLIVFVKEATINHILKIIQKIKINVNNKKNQLCSSYIITIIYLVQHIFNYIPSFYYNN